MPVYRPACAFAVFLAVMPVTIVAHAAGEPENVTSDSGPGSAGEESQRMQNRSNHIAGHIAFLKAELAITPAQEAAWAKVADAMRDDVQEYEAATHALPQSQTMPSAIDSLSERSQFADLRAKGERRFLDVFRPLYATMSPNQKQAADDLFAARNDE